MSNLQSNPNTDQRRAGVRRTVLITAAIAALVFVLFFVKQGLWH